MDARRNAMLVEVYVGVEPARVRQVFANKEQGEARSVKLGRAHLIWPHL
ncbi:MAG TPA: hypothetical protein VGV86_00610 [Acidimicrobiales bacterium]|nr:hypothetical protein [Acidimicrobiales bacterium]